ncbi:CCC motif membrane protein [Aureibaculum luteum]|uniref:CCC motif membrane protein n=1 Tax=Aureibaculum luteum TaxID=1548456 RepID=UPI000E46B0B9|nr:CCC motif membrane protein [Aureibaculum luteum]
MEQQKLPNATLVLIMGILSIVGACCYGLPGILFGLIGLIVGVKDTKTYKQAPENYSNYGNVQAGKIMAIIGLIISLFVIGMVLYVLSLIGWDALGDPELMQERIEELRSQYS